MADAPDNFLLEPTPHEEAAKWLRDKPVVSREVFDGLLPELRARAFLITGVEDANVTAEVREIVAKLPEGLEWEKAKRQIVSKLGPWLSSDDAQQKAATARAELILRTHGFQAYQVSQHRVMRAQADVFPFWQYLSLADEKVRPAHAALDGKVAPANSPFWHDHSPPWQWGCRCRKVAILPDEVDDMRQEDAGLPPEKQRVLEGPALNLAEQGRMYNAAGQQLDIKSDRQKGKQDGFVFDPDALTLPLSQLQQRYDPQTWADFEAFAKRTKLDDGRTVMAWLNGSKNAKKGAQKSIAAAPAPLPVAEVATAPDGTPLAGKLDVGAISKKEQARVNGVLAVIDSVHGDGPLNSIPVGHRPGAGNAAVFRHYQNGTAVDIHYRKTGKPELDLIHEIGHWLDHSGAPGLNVMTSEVPNGPFADFLKAARDSQAFKAIDAGPATRYTRYLQKPVELWARAYAQFIAEESQDATLLAQLKEYRTGTMPEVQWSTEDFKPIKEAMRKAFKDFGWMKESAKP